MTTEPFSPLKRALRVALFTTSATLAMGLVLSLVASGLTAPVAQALVWVGLAMLVTIPIVNVIDVLMIEWRLKEWPFVGAAVAVIAMLGYTVFDKLSR